MTKCKDVIKSQKEQLGEKETLLAEQKSTIERLVLVERERDALNIQVKSLSETLEKTRRDYDEQIVNLNEQKTILTGSVEKLQKRTSDLNQELDEKGSLFQRQFQMFQSEYNQKEGEMKARIKELEARVAMCEGDDLEKELGELKSERERLERDLEETRARLEEARSSLEAEKRTNEELSEQAKRLAAEKTEAESRRIELVLTHGEQTEALRAQHEAEKSELERILRQRIGELEDESDKLRRLSDTVKVEFENQLESLKAMSVGEVEALRAEKSELEETIDLVT